MIVYVIASLRIDIESNFSLGYVFSFCLKEPGGLLDQSSVDRLDMTSKPACCCLHVFIGCQLSPCSSQLDPHIDWFL